MEDYRCIHVTKILRNDCKIDSLIMQFHNSVDMISGTGVTLAPELPW